MRKRGFELSLAEMAEQLKKLKSATVFCHMRPDGDTLGAAMGLKYLLESVGAVCRVVCEGPVPEKFWFLEGMREIGSEPDAASEAYIAVDCSDERRLGSLCDAFCAAKKKKFNIDHHVSNTRFGDFWHVEDRAATCELMTELAAFFPGALTAPAANCFLTGISSDTGNFAHANVTEKTFSAAAKLVSCGADIHTIQYNMFKRQRASRAALFGKTMSAIRYFEDGKIAVIGVTRAMLGACGATSDMTEGFIDFPLSVVGVEVAVCLLETGAERFKVSLRSNGRADVNKVAAVYGGGGHVLASGCMLCGSMEEVIDKLRYTIVQHLED